jgi:hypothetical protein
VTHVKQSRVFQSQDIQLVRYGEDNVEIAGVEKFAFPCCQPTLTRLCLTLGTVPIATSYDLLFTATAKTLLAIASDPKHLGEPRSV